MENKNPNFIYGPDKSDRIAIPALFGIILFVVWIAVLSRLLARGFRLPGAKEIILLIVASVISYFCYLILKAMYNERIEVYDDHLLLLSGRRRSVFKKEDFKYYCVVLDSSGGRGAVKNFYLVKANKQEVLPLPFAKYNRNHDKMNEWVIKHFALLLPGKGTFEKPISIDDTKDLFSKKIER
jgi:hypothetical protein